MHHCKVPDKLNSNQQWKIKNAPAKLKEFYGFDVTSEGKVPLLLSLVMRLAAGTNNVIYQSMPCAPSVNNFAIVIKTSEITDDTLRGEVSRFDEECATDARDRISNISKKAPHTMLCYYLNLNKR